MYIYIFFFGKLHFSFSRLVVFSKESAWQRGQSYEDLWEALNRILHNGMFEALQRQGGSILNRVS